MKLGGVWEVGTFSPCQGQLFRAGRDPVLFLKKLERLFHCEVLGIHFDLLEYYNTIIASLVAFNIK